MKQVMKVCDSGYSIFVLFFVHSCGVKQVLELILAALVDSEPGDVVLYFEIE